MYINYCKTIINYYICKIILLIRIKMNGLKIISKALFFVSRIFALVYMATVIYSLLCLFTNWGITLYEEGKYMHINYPFTNTPFLNVDNNLSYKIFDFLLPITLYGLFFWLLSNVFKVFYQQRLFTQQNVVQLFRFYALNLTLPWMAAILSSFFVEVEMAMWLLVGVHFVLGIFTFFLAEIFKQGLHLQNEQDLYI